VPHIFRNSFGSFATLAVIRRISSYRQSALPLSILNQPQKTSRGSYVGPVGDKLLSEQRITYVTHITHEPVEDVVRQPIMEAVDQTTYRAHIMSFASEPDLRKPQRLSGQSQTGEETQQLKYATPARF
jgi:hypothetical protein